MLSSCSSGLAAFVLICATGGFYCATAQNSASILPMAPFVTSGTRTLASAVAVGSAIEVISAADLMRQQLTSIRGALAGVTGAPAFASGASGGTTSLFLRGANSNQTLFLVDGLRLNDPNTDYAVFLGGACVSACDSLEIAHGPQSTLYGGEAVGGVVSLRSQRGAGAPGGRVLVEAGSFGTVQGALAAQGQRGADAWNFSMQGGHTDNLRANNAFDSVNTTFRFDHTINERIAVGATVRWFHGVYGDPGDRYTNDPDNETREENLLATGFAEWKLAAPWSGRVVLGGQERRFVAESPHAGRATAFTVVKNRRAVLDTQTTFAGWERHRLTGGLVAEGNHTRNSGFGEINRRQNLAAYFVQDEFSPRDDLFLTLGGRDDDFDTFGRALTGRATAAWLLAARSVKIRATYGTAFRSPSFLDLFGKSTFYAGNPNLSPERARAWDAGVDWYLAAPRGTLSLTWFRSDFTDLIASTANFRSVENIQRARTQGLECSARFALGAATSLRGSYTYLEADNLSAKIRLLRRPRHQASVDLWSDVGRGLSAGLGLVATAQREDINAKTFRTLDGEDFTVARLYVAYVLSSRLAIKARCENLLGENYEEVNGYPMPRRGFFCGVEWTF